MVVITVIAVLSTMVVYGLSSAQASARDVQREQMMTGIQTALEKYYADNQAYPDGGANGWGYFCPSMNILVTKGYLPSMPVDPSTKTTICPTVTQHDGNVLSVWYIYAPSGYIWNGHASPCASSITYLPNAYELAFNKELGGAATYFCSPN